LRSVLTRDQQDAKFDFENRDCGYEKARQRERALAHAITLRSAFSGRLSSEITLVSSRNISRDRPT
jgi:hypothetical protein